MFGELPGSRPPEYDPWYGWIAHAARKGQGSTNSAGLLKPGEPTKSLPHEDLEWAFETAHIPTLPGIVREILHPLTSTLGRLGQALRRTIS